MHLFLKEHFTISRGATPTGGAGPVVFTSTGDKFIFTPPLPIDVKRWGYVVSTAKDATSMALTLDKRVTVGSDSGRVTIGTLTDTAARAAAAVVYQEPGTLATAAATQSTAEDGSLRNVDPAGMYHVTPGQELVIAVTDAADSTGQGYVWIEYLQYPFAGSDISAAVKIASTT